MVESYIFAGLFAVVAVFCGVLGMMLTLAWRKCRFLEQECTAIRRTGESQFRCLEDQKNKALGAAYDRRQELERQLTATSQQVTDLEVVRKQQAEEIECLMVALAAAEEGREKWFTKANALEEECIKLRAALDETKPQLSHLAHCEQTLAAIEEALVKVYPKPRPGMLVQTVQLLCSDIQARGNIMKQVRQRIKDTIQELFSNRNWVGIAMGLDATVPALDDPTTAPPREEFAGAGVELLASLQNGE